MWRRDGRELVYLRPDGALMGVAIPTATAAPLPEPAPLFTVDINRPVTDTPQFVMSPDGQRFLVQPEGPQLSLILIDNWAPAATAVGR